MQAAAATVLGMSKKTGKPGRPAGRPAGRQPKYSLSARIDPAIGAALERYVEDTEPRPTHTSVVELALRRLLKEVGYWPPQEGRT